METRLDGYDGTYLHYLMVIVENIQDMVHTTKEVLKFLISVTTNRKYIKRDYFNSNIFNYTYY